MLWGTGGWMGLGWVLMVVLWALVIVGAAVAGQWLLREVIGRNPPKPPAETAEEILRKRYARGEIDSQEFKQKLSDLQGSLHH